MKHDNIPVIDSIRWHKLVTTMVPELDSLTKQYPDGVTFQIRRQGKFSIRPLDLHQADVLTGAAYENDQGWWWITAVDFKPRAAKKTQ